MPEARDEFWQVLRDFLEGQQTNAIALADDLLGQLLAKENGWLILDGQVHEITGARWLDYTDEGQEWSVTTKGHG